ncbi:MAG: DUF4416 family protein [Acidobacteria bacterium]|nr:MAG: DUF4416 family protein [Acidobacteriota bacterium]
MSTKNRLQSPPPAKCLMAIMTTADTYHAEAEEALAEAFGPLDRHSERYDFSRFSPYYDEEMGGRVWKYFVTFTRLIPMDSLVAVKLCAEKLQTRFAVEEQGAFRRTLNLDPGYVTGWNLVLSTVKNHAHRLYLGQGVYGEVTLLFRKHVFEPLPWTYRDYTSPAVIDFFTQVRSDYLKQVENWSPTPKI